MQMEETMNRWLCLALLAVCAPLKAEGANQQPTTDLERRQQIEQINKAMSALDDLKRLAGQIAQQRRFKCMNAFGSAAFCDCLTETLAVGVDFDGYIAATTNTKDDLKYAQLSPDDKKLVDSALKTRQQCVGKVFGFQK
jgi:hypothetical protein